MADDDNEKIDGKYFYWFNPPMARPRGILSKLLFALGYVPRGFLDSRERQMTTAYNQHIYDTVIRDRKILLERLNQESQAVGEGLIRRIEELESENISLKEDFIRFRGGGQ